jgi:hypothetical protein
MFPRLRQQLLARVDLLVELSTLGEYGVDEDGGVMTLEPAPARLAPRVRDRCGIAAPAQACASDPAEARNRTGPAVPRLS